MSTAPLRASCPGRLCRKRLGAISNTSPSLELDGASWGHEGKGEVLGAPLPWIVTLRTSNSLAVTSVVLSKKLARFTVEAAVFLVCMSVKSACLSWGSRNPSAYQYHCIHSSPTRTDNNVKDSDGSEKCPCFILTLSLPVDTLADYCT